MVSNKPTPLARRIRQRMVDLDIRSVRALEDSAGVPRDSVRHIMDGTTRWPRAEKMQAIAAALDMSVDELFYNGEPAPGNTSYIIPAFRQNDLDERFATLSGDEPALHALAGESVIPSEPVFIYAEGDNMDPTIKRGDLVLVDVAVRRIVADGIYVIAAGNAMPSFRRVTVASSGKISIRNDNGRYGEEFDVDPESAAVAGCALGCYRPF